MKRRVPFVAIVIATMFSSAAMAASSKSGVIDPELDKYIATLAQDAVVPVIIEFADKVDSNAYKVTDRKQRNNNLYKALKDKSAQTLGPFYSVLSAQNATAVKEMWILNGVAATVTVKSLNPIGNYPGIQSIRLDQVVPAAVTTQATSTIPEWNINAIHAPDLWLTGQTGAGVVIANMDTGVDAEHPDLAGKWRGGANSWYDPNGQHATPYDATGHGTQTMGLMVGGAAGGTAIGVAPDATWIATKIFNDAGTATLSNIHLAFQWLMDPDGNPATIDAPDIVNASWSLNTGPIGSCNLEFATDITALKAAGIGVLFSAGNDGPADATSDSPANNPGGYSIGATDSVNTVASFSSRGPSGCDGTLFPRLVAPGVDVITSDLSFGGLPSYAIVSGTSFAAPHAAGAMALLAGAFRSASIADMELALTQGALDLGTAGPDNSYGNGLANAANAFGLLATVSGTPPTITSVPGNSATEASLYTYQVTAIDPGASVIVYSLETAPAGMTIDSAGGLISWAPGTAQIGTNRVVIRATDARNLATGQSFTISVAPMNHPPVASNNSYSVVSGSALSVAAPGVLANDSDPDLNPLTAMLGTGVTHGSLTLNANGSFSYTPGAGYVGADSFTYTAFDGKLNSNAATVTITVTAPNQPPVAVNDSYSATSGKTLSVAAAGVLANDSDANNDPITAVLVTTVSHGALTLNANGSFTYVPSAGYTGSDAFTYKASDGQLAGNTATVSITVAAANKAPVAVNDSFTAPYRPATAYTAQVFNVLANDSDADGSLNAGTVKITTSPNKGGAVTVNSTGTVSYTPKQGFKGTETFKYTVKDNLGLVSNTATVSVVVQ
jgi:bacillopeptidase F